MNLNEILFWSERDDLENDEMSSRDLLGTETFVGQLAESILPGLTTITWRVRYLTLICLWLRFIKEELQEDNADKILEHIKNLEKLTAYCISKRYSENGNANQIDIRDFLRKDDIQDSLNTITGKTLDAYIEFHAND